MPIIYKYQLRITDRQTITMPMGAEILHVASQTGEDICVWAKVENSGAVTEREFFIYGTGHPIPEGLNQKHLGTALIRGGSLVFHVFEVFPAPST